MRTSHNEQLLSRAARRQRAAIERRGSAIVPALLVASMLAMLGLSMLQASLSGSKVVVDQSNEYQLTSAVESAAILMVDQLWSDYLREGDGVAGDIESFRTYLTDQGYEDLGVGGPPTVDQGTDMLGNAMIPGILSGHPELDSVNIEAMRVARRDEGDATQLYVTVSATTQRGSELADNPLNRAIQVVYNVEPREFEGFNYGILTNNVNCIFCHTVVDSADRFYNYDPTKHGTFERVKVGSLESLSLRNSNDDSSIVNDHDADSDIAGTLYVRGKALDEHGNLIANWGNTSLNSYQFDSDGNLVQDLLGDLTRNALSPAGDPPLPGENLYLDYPMDLADMVDGDLPSVFPPPFPDNGGIDSGTGNPTTAGADNRIVDPAEFYAQTADFAGEISDGIINVTAPGVQIGNQNDFERAMTTGNTQSLSAVNSGNVVLTGTVDDPIRIDGEVAIDGDLVISGYVEGDGSLWVKGNVFIPSDLKYLDGTRVVDGVPTGERTFGIGTNGTTNALGLVSGGNVLIGDFLKPSVFSRPGDHDIIGGGLGEGFNFVLSEVSIFNRGEWAKTMPMLPGPDSNPNDRSTWNIPNPNYIADYLPRYYQFGEGNEIPIYNKGGMYWDVTTNSWHTLREAIASWMPQALTVLDPNNPNDPHLYDSVTGELKAVLSNVAPNGEWVDYQAFKDQIENMQADRIVRPDQPLHIDGLLYTNNAIFGLSHRGDSGRGSMTINGSLVCADLGLLAPGRHRPGGMGTHTNVPGSPYQIGLRLNYDKRIASKLGRLTTDGVTIKRKLWRPMANIQ